MEKLAGVYFDPSDAENKPTLLGTFPAHVIDFEEGNPVNGATPYNVTFRFAPEAADLVGFNWQNKTEEAPNGVEESAVHMVGRKIRSVGIWLNKNPKPGEGWKNRDYVNLLESCQIELPLVKVDGKELKQIVTMEEYEVLGKPILVTVKLEQDKREQFKDRFYPKGFSFQPWVDGETIDVGEDEVDPFATLSS